MIEQGTLSSVTRRSLGSPAKDVQVAGSSSLLVYSVADFSESGGLLSIDGADPLAYTGVDVDAGTVNLAAPLTADVPDGVSVELSPLSYRVVASVILDSMGSEAITDVRVPYTMRAQLPLGPRAEGEREVVTMDRVDSDEWTLVDIPDQEPMIDGSNIDPDTLPNTGGGSDGNPPTSSPSVEVIGGINCVYLKLLDGTIPENADPLTFDYLVGGVVFMSDPATLVSIPAKLSDGTVVLPLDSDTSFSVVARDVDGAAAAGPSAVGRPVSIDEGDLAQSIIDSIDAAGAAADAAQTAAEQAATDALSALGVANGKGKIIAQNSAPTGANQNAANLWIDTTGGANTPNRWDGSTWVPVTDKVASDAATAAFNAQTTATNASNAAIAAQSSADGKNKNTFSGSATPPTTTGRVEGDIHTQFTSGVAVKQWQIVSGAWSVRRIDGAVLTNLDAASINTGFLNVALLIQAGAIKADQIGALEITTAKLAAGAVTADKITVNDLLAGMIATQMLTAGVFRTALSGAREEVTTANGYRSFNADNEVQTQIKDGKLTARDGEFSGTITGSAILGGAIAIAQGTQGSLTENFESGNGATPPTNWVQRIIRSRGTVGSITFPTGRGWVPNSGDNGGTYTGRAASLQKADLPSGTSPSGSDSRLAWNDLLPRGKDFKVEFDYLWSGQDDPGFLDFEQGIALRIDPNGASPDEQDGVVRITLSQGYVYVRVQNGSVSQIGGGFGGFRRNVAGQMHHVTITLQGGTITVTMEKYSPWDTGPGNSPTTISFSISTPTVPTGTVAVYNTTSVRNSGRSYVASRTDIDNLEVTVLQTGFRVTPDGAADIERLTVNQSATVPDPLMPTDAVNLRTLITKTSVWVSAVQSPVSPFSACTIYFIRQGDIVFIAGGMRRASGSDTALVKCCNIPLGYRPEADELGTPVPSWTGGSAAAGQFQYRAETTGQMTLRQTANFGSGTTMAVAIAAYVVSPTAPKPPSTDLRA